MINLSLIFILFVTLSNVITTEKYDINKNICADCESYLSFCRISSYGFSVQLDDDSNKISINTQNSTTDDSLADCVPSVYQISAAAQANRIRILILVPHFRRFRTRLRPRS
ncbi:uncharacterized protein LOC133844765 isoform X3 [Drosophila sulfurigaster albostrigata]|uniref:uncharacterized protein LOC133844765 isoform X3 n=1 Tax=Drosophila sulfurigaster albostrigata TaxID=89887 RepID=UPI002D21B4E7|nr:uncharacterized protein LOC133844765 isoform X3 [Drosophila sulfurigaster albostrigata]